MFSKKAAVGIALLALAAFGVVPLASASAATAPRWKVAGAFLPVTATKSLEGTAGTVDEGGEIGFSISYTGCTVNGELIGSNPGTAGEHDATLRVCTGAKVVGAEPVCSVNSPGQKAGTVATNKLKGSLVYLEKEKAASVGLVFTPTSGTELARILITGAECSVTGEYPVTGEVVAKFGVAGETELAEVGLEFPTTPITSYYKSTEATTATTVSGLKIHGKAAKVTGTFKVKLSSKEKFGIFPS